MKVKRLTNLDQAHSLVDCVYGVYGLTFHRTWLYQPERLLELNQSGEIMSYLAIDNGKVVGHLAAIQPYFEVQPNGEAYTDPSFKEVGLSIVRPEYRGQKIQAQLGFGMYADMHDQGVAGVLTKCVTNHLKSQTDAIAMGGVPVALLLGSIPRWVVYGAELGQQTQPISTMSFYIPVCGPKPRSIHVPKPLRWISDQFSALGADRTIIEEGETKDKTTIEVRYQADRQHAQVHVLEAGADLSTQLSEKIQWLVKGKMAHLTVFLPADSAAVLNIGSIPHELGMFPAGWIPGFYRGGGDALIYQVIAYQSIDPEQVLVAKAGKKLKHEVVSAWEKVKRNIFAA